METYPRKIVDDVCAHHDVEPAEIAGLFCALLMLDAKELAAHDGRGVTGEVLARLRVYSGVIRHARAFAAGYAASAEALGDAVALSEPAERERARHRRIGRALSAIVKNAVAAGEHLAEAESLAGDRPDAR